VKVDSLLRGHVADIVTELRRWAAGRPVVVAPALPAMGRGTVGGRFQLDGDHVGRYPSLIESLAHLRPEHVDVTAVRHGAAGIVDALHRADGSDADGATMCVCDAVADGDLDAIVAVAGRCAPDVVWVGSSGLAKAIARTWLGARHARADGPCAGPLHDRAGRRTRSWPRCVAVVGSASSTAAEQAQMLAADLGVDLVTMSAAELVAPTADTCSRLRAVPTYRHLVVAIGQDADRPEALDPAASHALADLVADYTADADVLVLPGGATARSVLDSLQITALDVVGELEAGVVLLRAGHQHVVTKAGSFGDAETLVSAVRRLIPAGQSKEGPHR
jgi:4-hydroxythreonine-4-phosphate dehydrogenase